MPRPAQSDHRPTLVEFIHGSRRVKPARRRPLWPRLALAALGLVVFVAAFFLVLVLMGRQAAARLAADATSTVNARLALTAAAATEAGNSALVVIDEIAATAEAVRLTALAQADAATAAAQVTQTAQSQAAARATQARATEIAVLERDATAQRLLESAATALEAGDPGLALALAWAAYDNLLDAKTAHRVLRQALAASSSVNIADVNTLRFQPLGESFAVIPQGGDRLQLYDSANWSPTHEFADHQAPITAVAFSGDGRLLVSGAQDGELVLRAVGRPADEPLLRFGAHQGAVTALALDMAAGRLISAGGDPMLALWDVESGERLATYESSEADALVIDELLLSAAGERVLGWGSHDGRPAALQWDSDTLDSLPDAPAFRGVDASGRYAYSGGRSLPAFPGDPHTGDLIFWDAASGRALSRLDEGFNWSLLSGGDLRAASDTLMHIAFEGETALLGVESSAGQRRAVLVDIATGRIIRSLESELTAALSSALLVADETLLSASDAGRLVLWSSADGRLIREIGSVPADTLAIDASPAGDTIAALTADGALTLWRLHSGSLDPPQHLAGVSSAHISPNGAVLMLADADGFSLRPVDSQATTLQVEARLLASAGNYVAALNDETITVYELDSGVAQYSWAGDWAEVSQLILATSGDHVLAIGADLLLMRSGLDAPLRLAAAAPLGVAFDPTGERLLTLHHERALLWGADDGELLAAYPLGAVAGASVHAAFNASGDTLHFFALAEGGLAGLTSIALPDYQARRRTYIDIAQGELSADGAQLLLALNDGALHVVDTASGDILHHLAAEAADSRKLAYIEEKGLLLAAAGRELTLWDVASGQIERRLTHLAALADISTSRDGAVILTQDDTGAHRLWRLESPAQLRAHIEALGLPRDLSCAERARYRVAPLCA